MHYLLTLVIIAGICCGALMLGHGGSPAAPAQRHTVWIVSQEGYIIFVTESETCARSYADQHENITLCRRDIHNP